MTAAAASAPAPQPAADPVAGIQQDPVPAQQNNSTVQQEDPDTVSEDGDTQAVQSYLAQSLTQQLQGSVVNLSQGQYDQARGLVGDQYQEDLERFVDVSGDTDGSQTTESFQQAREQQQSFINQTQSYQETKAEYEEAVANGNRTRARELARELDRTAAELNETTANTTRAYTLIENRTGANLSREQTILQGIQQNITADAESVVQATFVRTRLSLSIDRRPISFLDPARLRGSLRTANGTPVANRTVTLSVGGQQLRATTDATGAFTVLYRPVFIDVNTSVLPVQYRPVGSSVYLGNATTVPIDRVEQITAKPTVGGPETAGFGDVVTVSGQVVVNGTPVRNVPVRITAGSVRLGTVRTNASGVYSLRTPLPAGVSSGERPLTASIPMSGQAIVGDPGETPIRITETSTQLDIAVQSNNGTATVTGQLTTTNGTAVPDQPLNIIVDGTVVGTVETGGDGRFSTTVSRAGPADAATVVTVRFESDGTNLARVQEEVSVQWNDNSDRQSDNNEPRSDLARLLMANSSVVLVGGVGILVVLSGAGLFVLVRSQDTEVTEAVPEETVVDSSPDQTTSGESGARRGLTEAERHLDDDPTAAVTLAFAAVREKFDARIDTTTALTHREFVRQCRDADLPSDQITQLVELVDIYEYAAFRADAVSDADGQRAVDIADTLLN